MFVYVICYVMVAGWRWKIRGTMKAEIFPMK
jgi:hypothetical protein